MPSRSQARHFPFRRVLVKGTVLRAGHSASSALASPSVRISNMNGNWLREKILNWLLDFILRKIADSVWPWVCENVWPWHCVGFAMRDPLEKLHIFLLNRRTLLENLTAYRRRALDTA
jgi:hypothetical protein